MSGIIAFFRASPPKAGAAFDEHRFRRVRWQTFIAMTLAYVTFYVCRLSFTVAKSALVELGITPTELGMIGSTLFFSYAIGKLVNGFIADHANVVRYMSLGLLLSAGMNLMMGMTTNALLLAIFWGINGWAQSMGVGPCAVSLARWYGVKERGTFYGIWSTAHNIGEAVTYMVIAAVIAGFGWQMGYLSTAALGAAGVVLLVLFGEVGLYRRRGLEGLSYYCHFSETERTEGESLQFVETVPMTKHCRCRGSRQN